MDTIDELGIERKACPVTTLYRNFIARHRDVLANYPRTVMVIKNLDRIDDPGRTAITHQPARTLEAIDEVGRPRNRFDQAVVRCVPSGRARPRSTR